MQDVRRCRNGYARGEGCGVVVLRRLSEARARGERILAVVRGTAVNQDGKSPVITAPDQSAQEEVIKAALLRAGIEPAAVQYVEAHGTGTPLGDPIELQALNAVYGSGRKQPLLVGSVKTNIGHLESAAGMAGLIKVVLSLQHEALPAHLHFQNPNPHVPWDELNVEVVRSLMPWRRGGERRLAGVSSFGFSGTNAHAIVEEAPEEPASPVEEAPGMARPVHLLVISGAQEGAVRELGGRYASLLGSESSGRLQDICYSAQVGRSHMLHRLAVQGQTREEIRRSSHRMLGGARRRGW